MVSVAWLFVFSKFIELTDTVSYEEALSLLAGQGVGALCAWGRCFLQPFQSDLAVLLSGITVKEATLGYCRGHSWHVIALEAVWWQ